jgi:tRNA pseudouridine13 synthase
VRHPEFDVLEANAHSRKLPRGALAGNRFTIQIRDLGASVDEQALASRIAEISRHGVPNYFGPQRFGHNGSNLARIPDGLKALRAPERGFVLSAARSVIFNAVLAERVRDGSWNRLEAGDIANLDGRGSIFPVDGTGAATTAHSATTQAADDPVSVGVTTDATDTAASMDAAALSPAGAIDPATVSPAAAIDPTLTARAVQLDLHPTGPLWGRGTPATQHRIASLESRVAADFQQACELTAAAGMDQERRALRLAVRDLTYTREPDTNSLVISFRLTRGSFATTVLRELIESDASVDEDRDEG